MSRNHDNRSFGRYRDRRRDRGLHLLPLRILFHWFLVGFLLRLAHREQALQPDLHNTGNSGSAATKQW